MIHLIGVAVLKVLGWKVEGEAPNVPKVVVIVGVPYHQLGLSCGDMYFMVFPRQGRVVWQGRNF
jgi:hypothetical protein